MHEKRNLYTGLGLLFLLAVWPLWRILAGLLESQSASSGYFYSRILLILLPVSIIFGMALLSKGISKSSGGLIEAKYQDRKEYKDAWKLIKTSIAISPFAFSPLLFWLCSRDSIDCLITSSVVSVLLLRPLAIIFLIKGLIKLYKYSKANKRKKIVQIH